MKKLILIVSLILIVIQGFSQKSKTLTLYEKGKMSFSSGLSLGFGSNFFTYSLNNSFGYFPVKNLQVGLLATQRFAGNLEKTNYLSNSVGVYGKYFFGDRKLKPWISTGFDFDLAYSDAAVYNRFTIPIGIGFDFAITDRISLEFGFYEKFYDGFKKTQSGIYPMFGIKIRL